MAETEKPLVEVFVVSDGTGETGMAAVDTGTLIEALGLDFQVPARGTALQGAALHSAQCTSALRSGSRIPTRKLK